MIKTEPWQSCSAAVWCWWEDGVAATGKLHRLRSQQHAPDAQPCLLLSITHGQDSPAAPPAVPRSERAGPRVFGT